MTYDKIDGQVRAVEVVALLGGATLPIRASAVITGLGETAADRRGGRS